GGRRHAGKGIVIGFVDSAGVNASGLLNALVDILSPYDAVGHGSHVAATATGNYGVPVVVNGFYYERASGMAIAVYKAIYPSVGTKTEVLAAMEQAIKDRVDILSLSIGPDVPPKKTLTMFRMFDIFMLFARKAGVLVIQAAGNRDPDPYTTASYSPWAVGVASCDTDRTYPGSLVLGNGQRISGIGLSGPTFGNTLQRYKLVMAKYAILANGNFSRTPEYVEECQHLEAFDPVIRNPSWSPSMIASAMATTAFTYDTRGEPIMAHSQDIYSLNGSTPFDHGACFVNPTRAIDPGLAPSDLNSPSLTISALNEKQLVRRTVKNVVDTAETYVCVVVPPNGVAVELNPRWFTIAPEGTQDLEVILKVTQVQDSFSYGDIVLTGNMKHIVRIPLSVLPTSMPKREWTESTF
nr:subtilisin-like protease SBT2.4 [Tanacetum cinerariifolium]